MPSFTVGLLDGTDSVIHIQHNAPVTVACTSPCGQVEWSVEPMSALPDNVTLVSRSDEKCSSDTGTCQTLASAPCPASGNTYMRFSLTLLVRTTLLLRCNMYVSFPDPANPNDEVTRCMVRGDSALIIVDPGK